MRFLLFLEFAFLVALLIPASSLEIPRWLGHLRLQQLQLSSTIDFVFTVSRIVDGVILFSSSNLLQASSVPCSLSVDSGFINTSPCPEYFTWPDAFVTSAAPVHMHPCAAVVAVSACDNFDCVLLNILFNETSNSSFTMRVSELDLQQHRPRVQRISIIADLLDSDDVVFAGGEQFSLTNMARTRLHVISSEKGVGRGMQPLTDIMNSETPGKGGTWWTTYSHFPALLQRNGWAVITTDNDYTVFDFTQPQSVRIEIQASDFSLNVLLGSNMMDAVMRIASITGLMQPLPPWVHTGAIIGLEGGQANVMRGLDSIQYAVKAYNFSVSGIWIQDWSGMRIFPDRIGLWWNWQLDCDHYPDFPSISNRAREMGARLLTYFNPQLINISAHDDAPRHSANLFQAAFDHGFLVMNSSGSLWTGYNGAGMLALHRPEVANWTATLIASQVRVLFLKHVANGLQSDFLTRSSCRGWAGLYMDSWLILAKVS
jgi:hypothetical protein